MSAWSRSWWRFGPNFPQPQPCWPPCTQGPHPTLLDGESRWWCCGISLRYAWRRHLARKASVAGWLSASAREAHRERGSLEAGRGPASLDETTALRIPTPPLTPYGLSSCGYQELGAWGPCGRWLRRPPPPRPSACHPDQQVTKESNAAPSPSPTDVGNVLSGAWDHEVERLPGADRGEVVVFRGAPSRPPGVIAIPTNQQSSVAFLSRCLHQNGQVDEVP